MILSHYGNVTRIYGEYVHKMRHINNLHFPKLHRLLLLRTSLTCARYMVREKYQCVSVLVYAFF